MERILLADDDLGLCSLLEEYLGAEGFETASAHDGPGAVDRALAEPWDLMVLDVMLPGMNGFDVLRTLRGRSEIPVLMLTARGEDVDRIVGLEMGADDYLSKPFNPRELVARIRAILRRSARSPAEEASDPNLLSEGDLELDPAARAVRLGGAVLELTSVEFNLLEQFLRAPGQVLSRERLSLQVLKRAHSPLDRSLDVHVSNLRKKLGPAPDGGDRIKTLRGEGYLFVPSPAKRRG